jgi:hypothetical protein
MPLINTYSRPEFSTSGDDEIPPKDDIVPLVVLGGVAIITADADLSAHFVATIRGTSSLFANLTALLAPTAIIEGTSSIFARGRLNGEPNEFGAAMIEGTSTLSPNGRLRSRAVAIIRGTSTLFARGRTAGADRTDLNVTLTIIPPSTIGFGDVISARLAADGVNYPIRSAQYSEPSNAAGVSLEFTLQKPTDRDAVMAATSFKFEIYTAGAWNTIFEAGKRSGGGFSFAWIEARPGDALSISTIGPVSEKINRSPVDDVTIYDNARETISPNDFKTIYDTDGNPYTRLITSIPGLTLYGLLEYVFVTFCDFAGVATDLPDYPIRRCDFEKTGTFLSGIGPHIGAFDPLIFVKDDIVWILDSTQRIPPGFASPYALTADKYKSATFNESVLNADGFVVTYSTGDEFDYSTDREVIDDVDAIGTFGDPNYMEISRRRTFRDFYKSTNPGVAVRTEKVREIETTDATVSGSFVQVAESTETINLDSHGRLKSIHKEMNGLIPDLATPSFPFITSTIRDERTDFTYSPQIGAPTRAICSKTVKVIRGLVVTDSDNEHLGRPFKQSFVDGFRAGNLSDAQTLSFEAIESVVETVLQNTRGQLEIRTRTSNFMTTPPSITNATTDARAGDLSTNSLGSAPETVIVFRAGASRTDAKLQDLSVGELPLIFAIPLARRRLANRTQRTGSIPLIGLQLAFGRGFIFELFDREGDSVGNYIIQGRTITLNDLGTPGQNSTQNLDVLQT